MTACLTLDNLALATPDGKPLFDNLTVSIGRECVGLVGRNGSGKSTLLRAIEQDTAPLRGTIHLNARTGRLRQRFDESLTVAETIGVAGELARLARITAGHGTPEDLDHADWTLEPRLEQAFAQMGLPGLDTGRRIASLSGGERTRLAMAGLLLDEVDLLLLDEPTNNLDAAGRAAIDDLIRAWPGGLLIASHDRALLEQADRIVELSPIGCTVFGGGWSEFAEARSAARARAAAEAERAANTLKATERKLQQAREKQEKSDSRGRAVRTRGDQPKMLLDKRQERAEQTAGRGSDLAHRQLGAASDAVAAASARLEIVTPLSIDLPSPDLPSSRQLLKLEDVCAGFGGRTLFGPLSLEVRGPQRIAIKGANGSGKSTLLNLIRGRIAPASGTVTRLTRRIAILDQHVAVFDPNTSLLENVRALLPALNENDIRARLARFAFRGEAALQPVGTLSGGERLRAGLAVAFAGGEPPELFLLDEPTNHLDIESVELLEAALKAWTGAIIVISHDTAFLNAIGVQNVITL
ncbi:ABC-F family ATP-binding cassette domain-containing protein [Henriciella pelagia]|jgi:ATPase subunit of ABC transporter with duplicated ATPase domains|uniref:ABC-F family ATP-binding cassette domain-containing protein n=1 Tax=Henriciella pelagia TaxID=1977912 RepID=UPI000A005306|nr:ABC-F family ATP-binding cassette domain-containing protein [Henriciella pelagia]